MLFYKLVVDTDGIYDIFDDKFWCKLVLSVGFTLTTNRYM